MNAKCCPKSNSEEIPLKFFSTAFENETPCSIAQKTIQEKTKISFILIDHYFLVLTHRTHHFTWIDLRVTECDITVEMDLIIVPDELEHSDMETACKRDAILS